jgi:hypothetical protein
MIKAPICPYCSLTSKLVNSSIIYDKDYGNIYICFPCNAYVGTHKKDKITPLGTLANKELREWRQKAHLYFDKTWKNKPRSRQKEYKKLAKWLGIEKEECHIGMFDIEYCKKVLEYCKEVA